LRAKISKGYTTKKDGKAKLFGLFMQEYGKFFVLLHPIIIFFRKQTN